MENTDDQKINNTKDNKSPDDTAGYYIRGFIKMSDPETGAVIVEKAE